MQLQPQGPRHAIPLKVCPWAAKLTVGGSQIGLARDPTLDVKQARKTRAKCNESRELRMAPQGAVIGVAILRERREDVAREGLALELYDSRRLDGERDLWVGGSQMRRPPPHCIY